MHTTRTDTKPRTHTKQPTAFFGGGTMPFFQSRLTVNALGDQHTGKKANQMMPYIILKSILI
jgi:hypothetical protein